MNKPYITCYMMTSIDGRIDCAMTENLPGVEEYYQILSELNFDATISGRVTAETEIAEQGKFITKTNNKVNKEIISKKANAKKHYEIIIDTKGSLLWKNNKEYDEHMLIIMSEQVTQDYLQYLDEKGISYIVTGSTKVNLARAMEILKDDFNIQNVGVVGGSKINTAFLDLGLLDEVIVLIGAGIDGRKMFPTVFENDNPKRPLISLKLKEVKAFNTGSVLIKYKTK